MNEATSFCNGELSNGTLPNKTESAKKRLLSESPESVRSTAKFMVIDDDDQGFTDHSWYMSAKNQSNSSTYYLPFIPGRVNLDNMTMSLNATHRNNMSEYDIHSLFGHF
jgi:hypothetical protein